MNTLVFNNRVQPDTVDSHKCILHDKRDLRNSKYTAASLQRSIWFRL
jgi:hypothetical protein